MPLNFYKSGADTGSALDESIQPIENREPLDETHLGRPGENLRNRTEIIREAYDLQELLDRSDRGLVVLNAPTVRLIFSDTGSTGYFSFRLNTTGVWGDGNTQDLLIGPLVSASTLGTSVPVVAKLYHYDTTVSPQGGAFTLTARKPDGFGGYLPRKVAEGAHNIYFRMYKETGVNTLSVALEGVVDQDNPAPESGPVTIAVRIADDNTSRVADLKVAIAAHTGANKLVLAEEIGDEFDFLVETLVDPIRFYEDHTSSIAGIDDELIRISSSALTTYFSTSANKLTEGAFLVVDFATPVARLVNDYSDTVTLRTIRLDLASDTRTIAKNPGTVPICKMLNGKLYFMNGRCFESGTWDYLVGSKKADSTLRAELAAQSVIPGDTLVGAAAKSSTNLTLAAGTVASQLTTISELGRQDSDTKGSAQIGSSAISVSPITLPAGTVRSQLLELVTQLADQVGVGADGASKVGAETYSSGTPPVSISQGTVSTQLRAIIDAMVGHFQGNSYKHNLNAITGFPFVVVNAAGAGNYTTITAAIDAIRGTTGGTIFVTAGTYTEAYALISTVSLDKTIHIVGCGNVVWQNSGSAENFRLGNSVTLNVPIIFENIKFVNSTGYEAADISCTAEGTFGSVEFYCCTFVNANELGRFLNFSSPARCIVQDCFFDGSGATYTAPVWAVNGSAAAQIRLFSNRFYRCCGIAGNGDSESMRLFEASYNDFQECGWGSTMTSISYLFNFTESESIFLVGNNYPSFTHAGTRYSLFLKVANSSCVAVLQNILYPKIDLSGTFNTNGSNHLINLVSTTGLVLIQDNAFQTCKRVGGVYCGSSVTSKNFIVGNSFDSAGLASTGTNEIFTDCSYGQNIFEHNLFRTNSESYFPVALKVSDYARVTENYIYSALVGVMTNGNYISVSGNCIESLNAVSGLGVHATGGYLSVSQNFVKGRMLVYSASLVKSTIEQNQFIDYGVGGGIDLTGDHCAISENIFEGNGSSSTIGVKLTGEVSAGEIIVSGNRVMGFTKGVDSDVTKTIVQSCSISTYGADHAIRLGDTLSQAVGNSIIPASGTPLGVLIQADDCVVSSNVIKSILVGVKVSTSAGKFFAISGNRIDVLDAANAIGVDASKSGATDCYGTILNNVITKQARTVTTGSYGIKVDNADKIACAGNNIRHYYSSGADFAAPFSGITADSKVGLGADNASKNTYDDYNMFQTS
jgi:hypothetical protein